MPHKPGTVGKYAAKLAERDMARIRRHFERQQASGQSEAVEQSRVGKLAAKLAERDMVRLRRHFDRQQAAAQSEHVRQSRAEGAQGDLAPSESHKGPQAQGKRNALRP